MSLEKIMMKGSVACMKSTLSTGGVLAPLTTMTTSCRVSRTAIKRMERRGNRSMAGVMSLVQSFLYITTTPEPSTKNRTTRMAKKTRKGSICSSRGGEMKDVYIQTYQN